MVKIKFKIKYKAKPPKTRYFLFLPIYNYMPQKTVEIFKWAVTGDHNGYESIQKLMRDNEFIIKRYKEKGLPIIIIKGKVHKVIK